MKLNWFLILIFIRFHFGSCWKLLSHSDSMPSISENRANEYHYFLLFIFTAIGDFVAFGHQARTQHFPFSISAMAFVPVSSILQWWVHLFVVFFNLFWGILCFSFSCALKLCRKVGKYLLDSRIWKASQWKWNIDENQCDFFCWYTFSRHQQKRKIQTLIFTLLSICLYQMKLFALSGQLPTTPTIRWATFYSFRVNSKMAILLNMCRRY